MKFLNDLAKQKLDELYGNISKTFEWVSSDVPPSDWSGPTHLRENRQLNYFTKGAFEIRKNAINELIKQIDSFEESESKRLFCEMILLPCSKIYVSEKHGQLNFDRIYLAVQIFLHYKRKNNRLFIDLSKIIKHILIFCEPDSNESISESIPERPSHTGESWEEPHLKETLFEIIKNIDNLEVQILALNLIIDGCHDFFRFTPTFGMSDYYEKFYIFYRNYYVNELIELDYPNKSSILERAVERICLMEKYIGRDKPDELKKIVVATLKINLEDDKRISKIFNFINMIDRICIKIEVLEFVCSDSLLFDSLKPVIVDEYYILKSLIDNNPHEELHVWHRVLSNCTQEDKLTLHNIGALLENANGPGGSTTINAENIGIPKMPELSEEQKKKDFESGLKYIENGNYQKAIKFYEHILETNPQDVPACCNKGTCLYELGHFQEAIECYDRAIGVNSQNSHAWYNKGVTLKKLGQHHDALICLEKAHQLGHKLAGSEMG